MEEGGSRFQAVEGRTERGARDRVPIVIPPKTFPTQMFAIGKHRGERFEQRASWTRAIARGQPVQKDAPPELREFQTFMRESDVRLGSRSRDCADRTSACPQGSRR